jgi:hypothetical protein
VHDPLSTPLRRAWIRGYKPADVEVRLALLRSELTVAQVRVEEAERARRDLETRLEEAHAREVELVAAMAQAQAAAERVSDEAAKRAEELLEEARVDAARVRAEAAREADDMRTQVEELLRLRDMLSATIRMVVRDFERVTAEVELGELTAPAAPAQPAPAAPSPPAASPSMPAPEPEADAPAPEQPLPRGNVFDRRVELEAGPFTDFASLSAFERAIAGLPKVEDVYVRRFQGDRAMIEVTLEEPAQLLDAMTEQLPYTLTVDHASGDRIAVSVSSGS